LAFAWKNWGKLQKMNQLGWSMLDRDTDLAPQERKSEVSAVDSACLVKGIIESKVLLEKRFFNLRLVGLYCAVLRYIRKIFLWYYNYRIISSARHTSYCHFSTCVQLSHNNRRGLLS